MSRHATEVWHTHKLVRSSTLAPPAVRCVVLVAHAWPDGAGAVQSSCDAFPVVGIRVDVVAAYNKRSGPRPGPHRPGSHREAVAQGWVYSSSESGPEEVPLIVSREFGRLSTPEEECGENGDWAMVACPWPESEDDDRLIPHVDRLTRGVVERQRGKATMAGEAAR